MSIGREATESRHVTYRRPMRSAGLVPYRHRPDGLEILIAHPGGPFWAHRQAGAWSIVKGEIGEGEEAQACAFREFREETGWTIDPTGAIALGDVRQKAGKHISAWAVEADLEPSALVSEQVTIDFRGRSISFPEIDEVRWCGRVEAMRLLNPAQTVYYDRLAEILDGPGRDEGGVRSLT
jgi:predicted NUDIX family NTP pyrophosphohydrolase